MERSRSQNNNRGQEERRRQQQEEERRKREQSAAGSGRLGELALERAAEFRDQDEQLRRAQARAARQQRVAGPAAQLAIQAQQQQAVRSVGQVATRAAGQQQAQEP